MEALQELSEDFLTCSICLNRYREPKQLPCLHSFCRGCLSDHIKSSDKGGVVAFTCPICRKLTHPPSSLFADPADDFPDNFYIASLISSLEKQYGTGDFVKTGTKLTSNGDNCPNHPESSSVTFCTASNVGVCQECQPFHKFCDDKHIPLHAAKTKAFSDISIIMVKMTSLHNHSKRLNETLIETPNNLRLRKEELISDISKHFSDMKHKFSKLLVDKEKEMTIRLKDIFKEEEKCANEAVDENLALTEVSDKKLQFLKMQSTELSINAIGALNSMEELMKKFSDDLARLENESDMKLIKYTPNAHLEELLEALTFGRIHSAHTEDEEPTIEATDDIDKQAKSYPVQVPVLPSAPPLYPPNTVYTQYPGQFYPPYPMKYGPVQVPTHGAFGGMVINKNLPPKPVHKGKPADQLYLERRITDTRSDTHAALVQTAKFNCRTPSDTRLCKIVGITPILEDVFVVVDRWNKNLKLIYLKGPVVKSVQLNHKLEPWDATRVLSTSREEVAVTCPSSKIIFFASYYNVSNQIGLNMGSQITTRVGYASLGGLSPTELVCGVCQPYGPPQIDIISMKGKLLRCFVDVVTYPRSIDTSPGRVIAISDWTRNHVVFLNDKGKKLSVYGPQMNLKEPKGVAFYEEDFFLVADHSDGCLHKISKDRNEEMVAQITKNVTVVTCVPVSSKFSKGGLGVVVATDEGCVHVYDGCHFKKETLL